MQHTFDRLQKTEQDSLWLVTPTAGGREYIRPQNIIANNVEEAIEKFREKYPERKIQGVSHKGIIDIK